MMKSKVVWSLCLSFVALAGMASAAPKGPVRIGEHVSKTFDSPHPYVVTEGADRQLVWSDTITHPGATYIAIHFQRMELAQGDYVVVRSVDGAQSWTYTRFGRAGLGITVEGFFATHIKGDSAVVELFAGSSAPAWGYSIDLYGRGYSEAEIIDFWDMGLGEKMNLAVPNGWDESICVTDDTEEAKCYENSEPEAYGKARAIARLMKNGNAHCTGWLVGTEGHLITNEHCVTSQAELNSIDFEFMAEGATCATNCASALACGGTIEATGGSFVLDSANLDYALIIPDTSTANSTDLPGTYGYLQLRETGAVLGERLYIVQHPAGWGKRFAMISTYPDDVTDGGMGYASSITEPACAGSGYSDVGYWSDTQGGSSGSPVLGYNDHKVIALHHCAGSGGCNSGTGSDSRNRGVPIQEVVGDLVAQGELPAGAVCDPITGSASLTATVPGANQIDVAWSAIGGVPGVTYDVLRSVGGCPQNSPEVVATGLTSLSYPDSSVSGGTSYAYTVVGFDPATACVSAPSPCDSVTATGQCTLAPSFGGAVAVTNQAAPTCGLEVAWNAATSQCGGGVRYQVHRSTTPGFTPDGSTVVANGLTSLSYLDVSAIPSGQRQYYVVRATDIDNSSVDSNMVEVFGRPTGPIAVSDWADDLESYGTLLDAESAGWSHAADAGTDDWDVASGDDATTGTGIAFISADVSTLTDKWMMPETFVVGAASELTFSHKFNFETGYDGAVIEISTDGGSNWQDLGPFITAGVYNDTISSSFSSPIGGRDAWSGLQGTFVPVAVDLSSFVGQSATIRFRLACDVSVADGDWLIDQFAINEAGIPGPCTPGAGATIFEDGLERGNLWFWSSSLP